MHQIRFNLTSAIPAPGIQFHRFLESLFQPSDLVEIRAIGHSAEPQSRRIFDRFWSKASELSVQLPRLTDLNAAGANIYFGVNPRSERAGTKSAVPICRSVWADLDGLTCADASRRWRPNFPAPSIVIDSGHGVHLYWLLDQSFDVRNIEQRNLFEEALKLIYRGLGADCTQDVTRLLRLPGFDNTKADRIPCRLVECRPERRYPIETFSAWFDEARNHLDERRTIETDIRENRLGNSTLVCDGVDVARIRGVLRILDEPVTDRSRRDFWVVCHLLKLGLTPGDIASLVSGRSKFTTTAYLQQTLQNALRTVAAE